MNEIIFMIEEAPEGGYIARAAGESIFTEADDLDALHQRAHDAVYCQDLLRIYKNYASADTAALSLRLTHSPTRSIPASIMA